MRFCGFGVRWLPVLAAVVAIGGFGVFPATAAPRVVLGEEFTQVG